MILVASNGFLNKAHAKYLESKIAGIAIEAKRYAVEQGRESKEAKLSDADIAELQGFIEDVRLLLPTLGHNFLEPLVKKASPKPIEPLDADESDLLYFRKDTATGKQTSEGFVVMKGAKIKDTLAPSASVTIKNAREKYASFVRDGILTEDVLYHYTSLANLPAILQSGYITLTESNLNIREGNRGIVWLTSSPEPVNHGLKFDDSIPAEYDKTGIRMTLTYKDAFRQWDEWSDSKGMDKGYKEILIAAQKNHLGIYPGAEAVKHFTPRLTEYKTSKGAIQFPYKSFGAEQMELITEIAAWTATVCQCGKENMKT